MTICEEEKVLMHLQQTQVTFSRQRNSPLQKTSKKCEHWTSLLRYVTPCFHNGSGFIFSMIQLAVTSSRLVLGLWKERFYIGKEGISVELTRLHRCFRCLAPFCAVRYLWVFFQLADTFPRVVCEKRPVQWPWSKGSFAFHKRFILKVLFSRTFTMLHFCFDLSWCTKASRVSRWWYWYFS